MIFVFGSNLAGKHGRGAALTARMRFGAVLGKGEGRQGDSYAIPTKDAHFNPLSREVIALYVQEFIKHAAARPDEYFCVTRIGCGLAGHNDAQMAPLFRGLPKNCYVSVQWMEYLT